MEIVLYLLLMFVPALALCLLVLYLTSRGDRK